MNIKKKPITTKDLPPKDPPILNELHIPTDREHFIEQYNNCGLCGTSLEFIHVTHFLDDVVVEESNCPHCMIKTRKQNHILQ